MAAENDDVVWIAICSNDTAAYPDDDIPGLREQVDRASWNFPYLVDAEQGHDETGDGQPDRT